MTTRLCATDGKLTIKGNLEYKGNKLELNLHGKIYPMPNEGNVIYGDLKGSDDFKVVNFQITKSPSKGMMLLNNSSKTDSLTILVLENRKNGDLVYIEFPMSLKNYSHFNEESKLNIENMSKKDHYDLISDISIMNRNRDHYSSDYDKELSLEKESEIQINKDSNTDNSDKDNVINNDSKLSDFENISIDRNELEKMVGDLKEAFSENQYKWIKRSNYDIPKNFFEDTGHKKDGRKSTDIVYAHTINNVNLTWTAITRLEIIYDEIEPNKTYESQISIAGHNISNREPVIVEYSPEDDLIRLRYQNRGVRVKDNHMYFKLTPGKLVFNRVTPNGSFAEYKNGFKLKNILGVIKYTSTISDIWNLIDGSGYYDNDEIGVPRKYPNTFDEQVKHYKEDKVIKAVSSDFKDTTMYKNNHRQIFEVDVSVEEDGTLSRGWKASFIGHF